jgi:multiple sugar transport system permease protein
MSTLTLRTDRKSSARARTKVEPSKARRDQNRRRTRWIWLFLLPTAILYGLYTLYPIVASYWYSLVEWNGFEADQKFVGIKNYQAVFADPMFWSSVKITLIFMLLVAPARVILSFLLAIVLNSPKLPFATLFRTVYFLPVVTTTAIVGVVMQFIFDPSSGPINSALRAFGISDGVAFLGDSSTALYTVAGVYVWKFFGVTMIYWLAALQTISPDVNEAAKVDGAGPVSIFRHITVPLLMPFLIIITLLTVEDTFRAFDLMQTMTGGGPFFSTEIIEIYIYRWAFAASIPQLGFASAAAVLFGLFVFVVGLVQLWGVYTARRLRADNS